MINNLRSFINDKMDMCNKAINTNYTNNVLRDYWTGYKNALKELERWYNEQLSLETQKICEEAIKNSKRSSNI